MIAQYCQVSLKLNRLSVVKLSVLGSFQLTWNETTGMIILVWGDHVKQQIITIFLSFFLSKNNTNDKKGWGRNKTKTTRENMSCIFKLVETGGIQTG